MLAKKHKLSLAGTRPLDLLLSSAEVVIYSNQPVATGKFGGRVVKTSALESRRSWVWAPPE